MTSYRLLFTKQAQKDAKRSKEAGLKSKVEYRLGIVSRDPFQNSPRYEKLVGNLAGVYSRRITIQHRLVYQVLQEKRIVKVLRMWTNYE